MVVFPTIPSLRLANNLPQNMVCLTEARLFVGYDFYFGTPEEVTPSCSPAMIGGTVINITQGAEIAAYAGTEHVTCNWGESFEVNATIDGSDALCETPKNIPTGLYEFSFRPYGLFTEEKPALIWKFLVYEQSSSRSDFIHQMSLLHQ